MAHFRQLLDRSSSAYTYLLADAETREALVIDPVAEQAQTVFAWLNELDLSLGLVLATHVHAGPITAATELKARTGAAIVLSARGVASSADVQAQHGDKLVLGSEVIRVLGTPGHTTSCVSYLWRDRVFTGDSLLIGGCGRTDLPGGDAGMLYDSVTRQLFALPGETLIYPGHDYHGRTVSTVAEERERNPCLAGKSRDEFITQMVQLDFPLPGEMGPALHATRRSATEEIHAA
jgi:glyoxylase-like metal-dependent hydrolase (beta-lactamase superfamily II)